MKWVAIILSGFCVVVGIEGCTTTSATSSNNLFARFYRTNPVPDNIPLAPPGLSPEIETVQVESWPYHWDRLGEQGYVFVGMSSYRGKAPDEHKLMAYAKTIGADLVVLSAQVSNVEHGAIPWVVYQPGQTLTTYHSGTAAANISSGGSSAFATGRYSGIATTRTPETYSPMAIPYSRAIYEVGASFWRRRLNPPIFGIAADDLPDDVRVKLQRNTGAWVRFVVRDGGAFRANILKGDVIIQFGDKVVISHQDLADALGPQPTGRVVVKVIRDSAIKDIEVDLGSSIR